MSTALAEPALSDPEQGGRRPSCIGLLALVAHLTRGGADQSAQAGAPVDLRLRGRFGGPPPTIFVSLRARLRGHGRRAWASHFPQHHVHPVTSNLAFATSISNHLLAQLISRFSPVSSAMSEKHDREILALG